MHDEENYIEEEPVISKWRLLVFLLAAIANAIGVPSGALILNDAFSPGVLTRECSHHLVRTEEVGLRQLHEECNNEYKILIRRLEEHIQADQQIIHELERR